MPQADTRRHVLILGGTSEAYALAAALAERPALRVTTSLAGRTANPRVPAGELRIGGFGGAAGLADFIRAHAVTAVIDATHPFASRMGWNAFEACTATNTKLLRLERPAWLAGPGDIWHPVPDWDTAVAALESSGAQRVLLALGRQELAPFARLDRMHFLIRSVDAPDPMPPFAQATLLLARGPFDEAAEWALLRSHGIDTLVCKNSGGPDGKLAAARCLGIRVVMRARPARPAVETVGGGLAVLHWLEDT